jgi:hypothetical protein
MPATINSGTSELPPFARYVRQHTRIYEHSRCKLCGSAGGTNGQCSVNMCLFCGTPQCSSNGLGNGQCSICFYGFLPGWSGSHEGQPCSYKGCTEPAVGRFPRKGRCCAKHGLHILGADYLTQQVTQRRTREWVLVWP